MKAIFYSGKLNSLSRKRSRTWPHIESELELWNSKWRTNTPQVMTLGDKQLVPVTTVRP